MLSALLALRGVALEQPFQLGETLAPLTPEEREAEEGQDERAR